MARAATRLDCTQSPSEEEAKVAAVEGWIHIPYREPLRETASRLLV